MDDDVRRAAAVLFAAATARLETAHEAAVEGQAPARSANVISQAADRVRAAAEDAIALASAAAILVSGKDEEVTGDG